MYRHYDGELSWYGFSVTKEKERGRYFLVCFDEKRIPGVSESYQKMREMLKENGFRHVSWGSLACCPWMFIDVETKLFIIGRAGVEISRPTGGHALTPDEFMMIYGIYKKYEDKEVLVF